MQLLTHFASTVEAGLNVYNPVSDIVLSKSCQPCQSAFPLILSLERHLLRLNFVWPLQLASFINSPFGIFETRGKPKGLTLYPFLVSVTLDFHNFQTLVLGHPCIKAKLQLLLDRRRKTMCTSYASKNPYLLKVFFHENFCVDFS